MQKELQKPDFHKLAKKSPLEGELDKFEQKLRFELLVDVPAKLKLTEKQIEAKNKKANELQK